MISRGNREREIEEVIGVGRRTFKGWTRRYRVKGIPGLAKGPFKGSQSRVTDEQKTELSSIIAAGPKEVGLDADVWTTPIIVKLVKDVFGISCHLDHMERACTGSDFPYSIRVRSSRKLTRRLSGPA